MHISAALFDNPRNLYTRTYVLLTVEYVNLIPGLCMEMALLRPPSPTTFHEQRVEIQFLIVLVHVMYVGIRMPKYLPKCNSKQHNLYLMVFNCQERIDQVVAATSSCPTTPTPLLS